jgi:hypothetical protein
MTQEQKKQIDDMDYQSMLYLWRFAKVGDPIFQGEEGIYFGKVMAQKRDALPDGEAAEISKQVGWREKP